MKFNNPFKSLRPWRPLKKKPQEKPAPFPQRKKEERGFDAKSLVIVTYSWEDFSDGFGSATKPPKEWHLGEVTKKVVFSEGHEKNTLVPVELLYIPLSAQVLFHEEAEEWQSNDSGMFPKFNDENAFRYHQLLMRLDSQTPRSKFLWEKGGTISIAADCVYNATYMRLLKLIVSP